MTKVTKEIVHELLHKGRNTKYTTEEQLKIGIEYQGRQHFVPVMHWVFTSEKELINKINK